VAAKHQALQTKHYAAKVLNTETDSKYRLSQKFDESIENIKSPFPILAKEHYIKIMIVCVCVCVCVHNYTSTYTSEQEYNWIKTLL
jgi:hypothetical protein